MKKNKKKVTKETFSFVEKGLSEVYSIKIRKGRYKNVIFTFGKVTFNENKENDSLNIDFQFVVEEGNTRYTKDDLKESTKFKDFIAEILIYTLEEEYGQYDEYTPTGIEENMQ